MKLINEATGMEIEEIIDDRLWLGYVYFKLEHERQIGKNWEEIEVHSIVRIIAKDIETLEALADGRARKLANRHQCEVRWNYDYSNQGHYIQPGN